MNALQARWATLGAREQRLVLIASVLVCLALLWWVALAPALQTVRSAPAQHAEVDAQLQNMRALAAEATTLRAQRALSYEESLRNLDSSVKQTLGAGATLSVSDSRASVTLKGVSANALAQWLSQARVNARVVPSEARLQRSLAAAPSAGASAAGAAASPANSNATWDGMLVLALPSR
jgi:general secretion pathway protein M